MKWTTVAAVLWFVFWTMSMVLAQIWCDFMPIVEAPPLYDLLHAFFPKIEFRALADIWAASHLLILAIYIGFFLPKGVKRERIVRVFFFLWGVVYAARTFFLLPTRFPRLVLESEVIHPDGVWWAFLNFFTGKDPTLADFMFSGHTATMALTTQFVAYYSNHSIWSSLMWVYTLIGAYIISMTFMHYTIDCFVALLVVDWTFHRYHSILDSEYLRSWRPGVTLTNIPGGIELPATLTDASGATLHLVGSKGKKRVNGAKYSSIARYSLWRALKQFDGKD